MQADTRSPGLAYQYVSAEDDRYQLVHLISGLGLGGAVETRWQAERWLALVAPLTDWTQEAPALQSDLALPEKVEKLRRQAEEEASVQLRSLLPDFVAEKLAQRARTQHCSFHDLVIEAVETFLEDNDEGEDDE
jgi:1,2-phenylacetyl-CoA epoxidase catalytic subunit